MAGLYGALAQGADNNMTHGALAQAPHTRLEAALQGNSVALEGLESAIGAMERRVESVSRPYIPAPAPAPGRPTVVADNEASPAVRELEAQHRRICDMQARLSDLMNRLEA